MARGEVVSIRVDGLSGVVRALISAGAEVEEVKDAMSDVAQMGARVASSLAPRLSGRLAADVRGNRARAKAVITAGRTSVPYAGPINYGWAKRNIAASGFMQRADQAIQPYALARLEQNINQIISARGLK